MVDASDNNAFKARLGKFRLHQAVKYDFNWYRKPIRRSYKVILFYMLVRHSDADVRTQVSTFYYQDGGKNQLAHIRKEITSVSPCV